MDSPFILYNPTQSAREQFLARSKALSHAAKAAQSRQRRAGRLQRRLSRVEDESTTRECTCQQLYCVCDGAKRESPCLRFALIPKNASGDPFDGLPIMMTNAIHETIVFWSKPALWDCELPRSHPCTSG
jgi:hypothetical protein